MDYWTPVREVVYFKRRVYVRALHDLGKLMFPDGLPPYPEWWPELEHARPRKPGRSDPGPPRDSGLDDRQDDDADQQERRQLVEARDTTGRCARCGRCAKSRVNL